MSKNVLTYSEVRDVRRPKVGDILVWPAELGPVKHLHGSVSTMRKLGFSVGRRWNAITYDQMKYLTKDPRETRFYLIYETKESGRDGDDMSLSHDDTPLVSRVEITELPAHLLDGVPSEYASAAVRNADDYVARVDVGPAKGRFGSHPDDWAAKEALDAIVDNRSSETDSRSRLALGDTYQTVSGERRSDGMFEDAGYFLANVGQNPEQSYWHPSFALTVPVKVLIGSSRYGARILRPSEDLMRQLGSYLASHALGVYSSNLSRLADELTGYERLLHGRIAAIRKCAKAERSRANALAKRAGNKAADFFGEVAGTCPDYRYNTIREVSKCSTRTMTEGASGSPTEQQCP